MSLVSAFVLGPPSNGFVKYKEKEEFPNSMEGVPHLDDHPDSHLDFHLDDHLDSHLDLLSSCTES